MTIEETKQIVDKIKVYRPNFGGQFDKSGFDKLKLEWFRILEPYDYADVVDKINRYFKDLDNEGKIPNPYYLIKYLKTKQEKQSVCSFKVQCPNCGCYVSIEDLDGKHYNRCLSTRYIITMRKKYFNKVTDIEELNALSDSVFWNKYYEFIDMLSKMQNSQEKDNLIKILENRDCNKSIEQITIKLI